MAIPGHRAVFGAVGAIIIILALPSLCLAANFGNFSVSLPAGSAVTMGDATGVLSFTVTNDASSTKAIKTLFFNIDTSLYDFDASTAAPTGCVNTWSVQPNKAACSLPGCISFTSGGGIPPGGSCTFDIVVTGAGDTAILSAGTDQADTLLSVVASSNAGASQQSGEFTLTGGLPAWQRKSLAAVMTASPAATGVGGAIVVTMTVTNRSSSSKSAIVGSPSPPTATGTGGVSSVGLPVYGSTASTSNPPATSLKNDMDASQTTVPAFDSSGYPGTGRLVIDAELIDYSGISGNTFTGAWRGRGGTPAAPHSKWTAIYSQNTSSFTLGVGESSVIKWVYEATSAGTVYFSAYARNGAGTATSKAARSNTVTIGDFTARVEATPLSVISGQSVFVTMTVRNNGSSTLTNVTPVLATGGTATKALVSGPDPSRLSSLAPGESVVFEWEYSVTGSLGQTYNFTGSATSDTISTNSSTSATGSLVTYVATVAPDAVSTGSTGFTATWTVYNNGSVAVKEVRIDLSPPLTSSCAASKGWGYQSSVPPANWTSATSGAPVSSVTFTANAPVGANGILVGQSKDFTITFNCVPQVMSDTVFNFPVVITDVNNNVATVNTEITVTAYQVALAAYDADCSSPPPASKPADGNGQYCFVATLTRAGAPAAGELLSFTSTAGVLSAASGVTDSNGQVTVYLMAPCSSADVSATVQVNYNPYTFDSRTVDFTAISSGTLSYVPGSLTFSRSAPPPTGDINPVSISTGDTGAFRLKVVNCGPDSVVIHPGGTKLAIRSGSPDTFALDSAGDITVLSSGTATLAFLSGTIRSQALQCYPILAVDAATGGSPYTGPYSAPGDSLSDTVTVSGGTECSSARVRILDWREVY